MTSPGTPTTPGEPRFAYREGVILLVSEAVTARYDVWCNGQEVPAVALPLPTYVSALKHAIAMTEPLLGCEDCPLGEQCDACVEDARLRVEYGELLAAIQETSGTEGNDGE